jgi:hypothetical protein
MPKGDSAQDSAQDAERQVLCMMPLVVVAVMVTAVSARPGSGGAQQNTDDQ